MTSTRNIKHKAVMVRARARKTAGRVTGNRHQQSRGRREQVMGNLGQVMTKFKDVFRR